MHFYYTILYTDTIPYLSLTVPGICRCGRAGQRGVAHSLLTKQDAKLAPSLAALLRASNQPVKKTQNKK
jgi:superfamily II DNA/RNA helicase